MIVASAPARIEAYDSSGRLISVDADGDGAFTSKGDIIRIDSDNDGVADCTFAEGSSSELIELRVLPQQTPVDGLLEVSVDRFDGASWTTDAINTIQFE